MKRLSITQAARRLGVSERAVYDFIAADALTARGKPLKVVADDVDDLILDRQRDAIARVEDSMAFAEKVRAGVRQRGALSKRVPQDRLAVALWGPHVVTAASLPDSVGCRWCWAFATAGVYGGLKPAMTDPCKVLLGAPCERDARQIHAERRPE
jgi:hypothetical protein